jgi:hypothetical protein
MPISAASLLLRPPRFMPAVVLVFLFVLGVLA